MLEGAGHWPKLLLPALSFQDETRAHGFSWRAIVRPERYYSRARRLLRLVPVRNEWNRGWQRRYGFAMSLR
jgi:hypothetical protein